MTFEVTEKPRFEATTRSSGRTAAAKTHPSLTCFLDLMTSQVTRLLAILTVGGTVLEEKRNLDNFGTYFALKSGNSASLLFADRRWCHFIKLKVMKFSWGPIKVQIVIWWLFVLVLCLSLWEDVGGGASVHSYDFLFILGYPGICYWVSQFNLS